MRQGIRNDQVSFSAKCVWVVFAVHLSAVCWAAEPDNPVFRGVDPKFGVRLARVTVDLIAIEGSEGTPAVAGFQARRFFDGRAQFGLQSMDPDIRRLEGRTLIVRVDSEPYAVPFQQYDSLVIGVLGRLPPIHQLWFGPLTDALQAKLKGAKQIIIEFEHPSGGHAAFSVSQRSAEKIGEVMQDAGTL